MRRRSLFLFLFVLPALVLAACRPMEDPPPPTPPPLPAAPTGNAAAPAVLINGANVNPLRAPDPDVVTVDPSWCATIPPTTTTSTTAPTTTTTAPPSPGTSSCYYAYSTPTIRFAPTAVPVSRSTDLVHWYPAGSPNSHGDPGGLAFDGAVPGGGFPLWAPTVLQTGPNRFVMWFTENATAVGQMCLWSATATSPDGPFTYATGPWCKTDQGGVIDPALYVDENGTTFVTYKTEGIGAPFVPTRTSSRAHEFRRCDRRRVRAPAAPRSFRHRASSSRSSRHPTFMRSPAGTLFLFYSAYNWFTADYKVAGREVRCADRAVQPRVLNAPVLTSHRRDARPRRADPVQGRSRHLAARVPRLGPRGPAGRTGRRFEALAADPADHPSPAATRRWADRRVRLGG